MKLEIESHADAKIIRVKEPRLIFPLLGEFSAKIMEIIDRGTRKLEIDLTDVNYLDSASYGCLLDMNRLMLEQHGTIKLVGLQERVESMGALVGLTRLMETIPAS